MEDLIAKMKVKLDVRAGSLLLEMRVYVWRR